MRPRTAIPALLVWFYAAGPAASAPTVVTKVLTRTPWQDECGSQYAPAVDPFLTTEPFVHLYFSLSNLQETDNVSEEWIQPNGGFARTGSWSPFSGSACFSTEFFIAASPPARLPGDWQVRIKVNGSLLFSLPFRIIQLERNTLRAAFAVNATAAVAAGESGIILRTTNGGLSWQGLSSGTTSDLNGIAFSGSSTGIAVGQAGTILRTANGGTTWTAQNPGGAGNDLRGVAFAGANTAVAVGEAGTILRTADGGATWTAQFSGTADDLWGVCFANAQTGTAVGDSGRILRTSDGGATWISQATATDSSLFAVSCADANHLTAVGEDGTILHTEDGGLNWAAQSSGSASHLWGVSFTDVNNGAAVGQAGTILRTSDAGTTWSSQAGGFNWLYSVSFAGSSGTAVGFNGDILQTTDGGVTWKAPTASVPLPAGRFSSLTLVATAVNGNQADQVFTVTYADGSTTPFRQSLSDWLAPQKYAGESTGLGMGYRNQSNGNRDTRVCYVYTYTFPLDSGKTVSSISRPSNRSVAVLAMTLTPASGPAVPVDLSRLYNIIARTSDGIGTGSGLDGDGFAYSAKVLAPTALNGIPVRLGPEDVPNAVSGGWLSLPPVAPATVAPTPPVPVDTSVGAFSKINTSVPFSRRGHTATLLKDGRVLLAGGFEKDAVNGFGLGISSGTAYLFNPATGAIAATGAMNTPREWHAATLLADGRVLIAGGYIVTDTVTETLDDVEIYDPATGKFTEFQHMRARRAYPAAILLANGQVLIAGGFGNFEPLNSAEILADGAFQFVGNMSEPRSSFTLTALANGKVLAAGGGSADVYDPAAKTFKRGAALSQYRSHHVAVRLPDDRVLLAGGDGIGALTFSATAELIAADGSASAPAADMTAARTTFQATPLNNGLVLLTGGGDPTSALASAEVYDPATLGFRRIAPMAYPRSEHTATKTSDGRVVIVGGGADTQMEWFTPAR